MMIDQYFAFAIAAIGILAGALKLILDWRNAPISREKSLLDMMASYSEQLAENQKATMKMREMFEDEISELRIIVAGLRDRVAWLEKLLRENNIDVAPLDKRIGDRPTQPRTNE